MSLVELMVGLAIAIVGMLTLSAVLQGVSAQKRTTVGSSDAQSIGGLAAYMIERDLRRAGYGANSEPALGCSLYWTAPIGAASPLPLDPVRITAGTTDQVVITYAQGRHGSYYTTLQSTYQGDSLPFVVNNTYGFTAGDLILVGEATSKEASGRSICAMYEVSNVTAGHLEHTGGTYNGAAGNALQFGKGQKVYNLGLASNAEVPTQVTYAVNANNELTMNSAATNYQTLSVAEQIVGLKAYYCKDTVNATPSTINVCDQTIPTNAAGWRQVLAVRFAIVARSGTRETNAVTTSPVQVWPEMTLPNGSVLAAATMPLTSEQTHYRYRVFGSMVPIRNLIWQVPNS